MLVAREEVGEKLKERKEMKRRGNTGEKHPERELRDALYGEKSERPWKEERSCIWEGGEVCLGRVGRPAVEAMCGSSCASDRECAVNERGAAPP